MANNRQQRLSYFDVGSDTIAPGANLGFYEELINLHTLAESIGSADGKKIRVTHMIVNIRAYMAEADGIFHLTPVVVQTNGNCVDTVNLAARKLHEIIDGAVDDVFGFQVVGPTRSSRRVPMDSADAADLGAFGLEFQIQIPQNLLQVLNKEIETERLQDLHLGFAGITHANNTISVFFCGRVDYIELKKQIILR
jgi:hypothetical protein